ncbi:MAG: PspC domain-containing protein [Muribaculaceae bacterium]|nr:PspC domain-containing protein [Muribaculaceae bacterium]
MSKKLTKSATDKKLAGVCGGLGEYFNLDPVIFRALFVLLVICAGCGVIAYLIMALLMGHAK